MGLLRKLADLILYSSVWVAICAALQVQLTYIILDSSSPGVDTYTVFIFCGTLALYCLHRLIGLGTIQDLNDAGGRFKVIKAYQAHIKVYCTIGFAGGIIAFLFLSHSIWPYVVIPAILAGAYVVPIPGIGRRLRDYPLLKIFVLAVTWAFLTVCVPALSSGQSEIQTIVPMYLERAALIFALTIPFDIRDASADDKNGVRTLPNVIGFRYSKMAGILALSVSASLGTYLYLSGTYSAMFLGGSIAVYIVTAALVAFSNPDRSDYYFTGAVDGMMILLYLVALLSF